MRVDRSGAAYYLTHTRSADAPVTPGAFQRDYRGNTDLMLVKLAPDGRSLLYSTYFGGSGIDFSETHGLAIDEAGNAYVGITTKSTDLPVFPGSYQRSYRGGGGLGTGAGTNYPGDGFVAKISPDGSSLLASTYLGGSGGEGIEGIAVDAEGNVIVGGATYSGDFPVTIGGRQTARRSGSSAFGARLSPDLSRLIFSTAWGGQASAMGRSVAVDTWRRIHLGGMAGSDAFVVRFPVC